MKSTPPVVILISANAEWRAVSAAYANAVQQPTPYGNWFESSANGRTLIFFHQGWGKIAAAGATQYAIDRWSPPALINLGTCGGFTGAVARGEILLAEETLVYDIIEQMGDPDEALRVYTTRLDLDWLPQPYPLAVRRARLISADRDILAADIPHLQQRFGAIAADWESGAIAWVAQRNGRRCLILRGVTDLVGPQGGEAYGDPSVFERQTHSVFERLLPTLPAWLEAI